MLLRLETETEMRRNWERERNYWLDHFGQYHPGMRRNPDCGGIGPKDTVGIPVPPNLVVPLNPPCLIWRWALRGGGYGTLNGRPAHVLVFEQTRGRQLREGYQVNHLCNRPFCVQPAHLYEGTAKQNSEDRQAELDEGRYPHWQEMVFRLDRAMTQHHWPAPELLAIAAGWDPPMECPHVDLPEMFEKAGKDREKRHCANCLETRTGGDGDEVRARPPCGMKAPCRCEPGKIPTPATG